MKKVLITGGAGFIGANFVHKFLTVGYKVFVMERKGADFWRLEKVKSRVKIYTLDIANEKAVEKCIRSIKPEIVLHFATYGAYQRFQQNIHTTVDINLAGTINLLNACQKTGVKCFINTGTNAEYGMKEKPMKESDLLEPDTIYGITKAAATLYCQMMARKCKFPVVTLRPFAVYGYFEEPERLMPSAIIPCLKSGNMKLSKPDFVRPFIFIEDVMDAYALAIKHITKVQGQIINIGGKKQYAVSKVVALARKITNSNAKPEYGRVTATQTEPKAWVYDISKAKQMLGWQPKHNLEEGLKKNIAWFKEHIHLYE